MPMYDRKCLSCEKVVVDCWESFSAPDPTCECGGIQERKIMPTRRAGIGDEIDVTIKNGLCNPDGSPRRYTSRAELRREEQRRGMENHVVHIGSRGSDKSKHTVRWV